MARFLKNIDVSAIAFVDKAANKKRFFLMKRDGKAYIMAKIDRIIKGGEGFGNFGHSGRPGEVGGSGEGGGGSTSNEGDSSTRAKILRLKESYTYQKPWSGTNEQLATHLHSGKSAVVFAGERGAEPVRIDFDSKESKIIATDLSGDTYRFNSLYDLQRIWALPKSQFLVKSSSIVDKMDAIINKFSN